MTIETATATEMQNNFGRYLNLVMSGQEVMSQRTDVKSDALSPKIRRYPI